MAQVSAHKCSLCDENNGAHYCYECQQALCAECRNRHGKIPALSGHTVADINTVNLSTVNKTNSCDTHKKEIQFYCTECSDLICSKCVTSTHKSHSISDITDVVLEEREKAKANITELKLKTEAISSLQEKIRREHIEKLHVESKKCIEHMESVCKDLHSFINAKGSMKTTEVEDNENIEKSNFEAFLKNNDLVHKQYVHILTELENLLLEKHDITFYSRYISIQSDIQTLVNIPEEPPFAQVPGFDDEVLYREAMEHMESKIDKSLCQNCSVQKKKIEDLQLEYKICKETFHRGLETKDEELKTVSENVKLLQEEMTTMQSTFASATNQKDAENKKLSENIECLKKDIEKKTDAIRELSQEIRSLEEGLQLKRSANTVLSHPISNTSMKRRNRLPPPPRISVLSS
ncbi:protein Hook homolog 1-like [Mytilus edulis]|uniref:protein Hook homolog 1-like n=1 Tax=Mytilus edulis TaxID=6550 RepID=UPI0039F06BD4